MNKKRKKKSIKQAKLKSFFQLWLCQDGFLLSAAQHVMNPTKIIDDDYPYYRSGTIHYYFLRRGMEKRRLLLHQSVLPSFGLVILNFIG